MKRIKKLVKNSLAVILVLCAVLNSTLVSQALEIGGGAKVNINKIQYTITTKCIDDEGNMMPSQAAVEEILVGAGKTYTAARPAIEKYTYIGYYVDGIGSLDKLSTGEPKVTSKSDGKDSSNGKGAYTLNIVYSADKNENEIPDKNEHYIITEKFEDTEGKSLLNDNTVNVDGAVEYNGVVPAIPGYKYVGYYFKATHMSHEGGSVTNLLEGTPYILLLSKTGIGAYVNHMVFEHDPNQWATITYHSNADDAAGTMDSQTGLKNAALTLNPNQFMRDDYIFLGWSSEPQGPVEYADQATITPDKDMTLYAIWGQPDLSYSFIPDKEDANVGDDIGYTLTLANNNTANSTPWYNAVATVGFNEYVAYTDGSVQVKLNGKVVERSSFNVNTNELKIDLGNMNPGDEYIITFNGNALATGEGVAAEIWFGAVGDLIPTTKAFRSAAPQTGNKVSISGSSGAVTIVPAE